MNECPKPIKDTIKMGPRRNKIKDDNLYYINTYYLYFAVICYFISLLASTVGIGELFTPNMCDIKGIPNIWWRINIQNIGGMVFWEKY